jgi:hypothetical protein
MIQDAFPVPFHLPGIVQVSGCSSFTPVSRRNPSISNCPPPTTERSGQIVQNLVDRRYYFCHHVVAMNFSLPFRPRETTPLKAVTGA